MQIASHQKSTSTNIFLANLPQNINKLGNPLPKSGLSPYSLVQIYFSTQIK